MSAISSASISVRRTIAQTVLYALTDRAELYRVNVSISPLQVTRVSSMATRFTGGFGNVMDFNPVANALRVTGTNDQNLAVVDGTDGTSLSSTVVQTRLTYAAGDPAAGQDPEITGGAYSNNFVGATSTIFLHDRPRQGYVGDHRHVDRNRELQYGRRSVQDHRWVD
jgi:hypothetical protein